MDCWIVIAGGKLQNFAARSYRFTMPRRVFHLIHGSSFAPRSQRHNGPRAKAAPEAKASIDLPRSRS
jgi:hypothetical protein